MLLPKFDEGAYQPSLRLEHKGLNICLNIYKKTGTWKGDVYMWKLTNAGPNDMKGHGATPGCVDGDCVALASLCALEYSSPRLVVNVTAHEVRA